MFSVRSLCLGCPTLVFGVFSSGSCLTFPLTGFVFSFPRVCLCFTPILCRDLVVSLNSSTPAFSIAVKTGGPWGCVMLVAHVKCL